MNFTTLLMFKKRLRGSWLQRLTHTHTHRNAVAFTAQRADKCWTSVDCLFARSLFCVAPLSVVYNLSVSNLQWSAYSPGQGERESVCVRVCVCVCVCVYAI